MTLKEGKKPWSSDFFIIGIFAFLKLLLHLLALKGFGYFRDELYYIACSDHLGFGFVDQPPLSILLLKAVRLVFGDSTAAIRLLPALGGALFVFLTGIITRELGGKKFAVAFASAASLAATGNFFIFHIFSMNFLDLLFWQACILIVIRIIKTGNAKYWLLFGLTAGLGLQNKISILFLCFGLSVGLLITRERKHFKNKYFWLGLVLAGLLLLPYVLWNLSHGWPTVEFMDNARIYKMADVSPVGFFLGQIIFNNPVTVLIWLPGLAFLIFHQKGKRFRLFGWMFLSIYLLFTIQEAKSYYLAPAYPVLFAGGALLWEHWLKIGSRNVLKTVLVLWMTISALVPLPITLPLLSAEKTVRYTRIFGGKVPSGERHTLGALPQHFADMFGWEKMAAVYGEIFQNLSTEEQSRCVIYVRNYGEAGAVDFFGKKFGLPKATCAHNSYWFWGPGKEAKNSVYIIRGTEQSVEESYADLSPYFDSVEYAATFTCTYCMPYENNNPIFICWGFKGSLQDIWEHEKHFE
ncbi:MAG: glycosyltransferase family 39 protein [Candidatus Aminicenantes bacterium]|nr:glycosyltransferase family 39 protein [Candidatus Aminicenantes bacterium]